MTTTGGPMNTTRKLRTAWLVVGVAAAVTLTAVLTGTAHASGTPVGHEGATASSPTVVQAEPVTVLARAAAVLPVAAVPVAKPVPDQAVRALATKVTAPPVPKPAPVVVVDAAPEFTPSLSVAPFVPVIVIEGPDFKPEPIEAPIVIVVDDAAEFTPVFTVPLTPFEVWLLNPTFTCDEGFAPGYLGDDSAPTSCVAN